jgi:membrane-associated protease RseP (regulator of RpoE activity)
LQAFNLLPVGCLDGGRLAQAAYGRRFLNLSSVLCYLTLFLGFVGGTMSLPFGLLVFFAQRKPETFIQDEVTDTGKVRENLTVALVLLALCILVPFSPDAPEVLDSMQGSVQVQMLTPPPDPNLQI